MTWTATHIGTGGVHSVAEFPEWIPAANWLRAMMEVSRPEGVRAGMIGLAQAVPGTDFSFSVSKHRFELSGTEAVKAAAARDWEQATLWGLFP